MDSPQLTLPACLTAEDVAALTGLSRASVYEGLHRGDLPGLQVGKRWIVSRQRLQQKLGCSDADVAAAIEAAKAEREKAASDDL